MEFLRVADPVRVHRLCQLRKDDVHCLVPPIHLALGFRVRRPDRPNKKGHHHYNKVSFFHAYEVS